METTVPLKTKRLPKQRHFLAVFFISFMWGVVGADRMYLGKWGTGVLKLVTGGGLGLWVVVDLLLIMTGYMRDKQGRELLEFHEYKNFAYKTVLIFAVALAVVMLISGLALIATISQLFIDMQNGAVPGLDLLKGSGLSPDQINGITGAQ